MIERNPGADEAVVHLLRRVLQSHTAAWQQRVPQLTKPQYAMLDALRRRPGIDQVTLGSLAATDKGTTTELLRRMERNGWLTRTRSETDQRRRLVHLTDEGERLATGAATEARALAAEFLAPLDRVDRTRLHDLLARLAAAEPDGDGESSGIPHPGRE